MNRADLTSRLAFGAAAGLAGTMTMWNLRVGSEKLLPETMEPVKQDPGEFMVEQAEEALPVDAEEQVPGAVETAAAQALHMAYGVTFGILYAMLRPRSGNKLVEGIALGLGTWAVGYLGWLPATGLVPPVTRHEPKQILGHLHVTRSTALPPWPHTSRCEKVMERKADCELSAPW